LFRSLFFIMFFLMCYCVVSVFLICFQLLLLRCLCVFPVLVSGYECLCTCVSVLVCCASVCVGVVCSFVFVCFPLSCSRVWVCSVCFCVCRPGGGGIRPFCQEDWKQHKTTGNYVLMNLSSVVDICFVLWMQWKVIWPYGGVLHSKSFERHSQRPFKSLVRSDWKSL